MSKRHAVAFKIDVDTHDGMRDGVPVLLETLEAFGIKATFCLSYGPDNAGRAIFRLFRDTAFLKKMLNTSAPSLYGWRTILSGTLLPARPIATAFPDLVRNIATAGHEIAVHAWDHRKWQDHLHEMSRAEIRAEFDAAFRAHEKILGSRPHAVAAPGWQATEQSLEVEAGLGLRWASDLRQGPPCYLEIKGRTLPLLQIPTTGPCIEELLASGCKSEPEMARVLCNALASEKYPVLAVHAEVEGGPYAAFFKRLIPELLKRHGSAITLGEMADRLTSQARPVPTRRFAAITLPGRAGKVASSR